MKRIVLISLLSLLTSCDTIQNNKSEIDKIIEDGTKEIVEDVIDEIEDIILDEDDDADNQQKLELV